MSSDSQPTSYLPPNITDRSLFSTKSIGQNEYAISTRITRVQTLLKLLLVFSIPFFLQVLMVKNFGVNLPFWDEWSTNPGLLAQYRDGTLTIDRLFAFHNEHRVVTLRLALIGLFAFFGEWNTLANMVFSAFLVASVATIWSYALQRINIPFWVAITSSLILVSPSQHENIAWGFQIQFYSLIFGMIFGIAFVALSKKLSWLLIFSVVITCSISTFSIAAGLLSWFIIGLCLIVKAALEESSFQNFVRNKQLWSKLIVFGVFAIIHGVFYLHGFQSATDDYASKTITAFIRWIIMALSYPMRINENGPISLLIGIVIAQWLPVVIVCARYIRHRHEQVNRQKCVLLVGIALFMSFAACIIAYGRGSVPEVQPRYTTIFLWSSLACLVAIADLLPQTMRLLKWQRYGAMLLLCGIASGVLVAHQKRSIDGLHLLEDWHNFRQRGRMAVIQFMSNPHSDRTLNDDGTLPYPWPDDLQKRLIDPVQVAVLPDDIRTPIPPELAWTKTGDAWRIGSVSPLTTASQMPDSWGSWAQNHNVGQLTSPPIHITNRFLIVPVAGYPNRIWGNHLSIVSVTQPSEQIIFAEPDPRDRWGTWQVDVSRFQGQDVRIVAEDGSDLPGIWLGVGWPHQEGRRLFVFYYFLDHLELIAGACFILLGFGLLLVHTALRTVSQHGSITEVRRHASFADE